MAVRNQLAAAANGSPVGGHCCSLVCGGSLSSIGRKIEAIQVIIEGGQ